ncbi:MAG: hypothetical protein FWE76_03720 [Symbiobacteriaceae bacterium]|nr:hypothetical protein [Symbiobacteriaceae bacterium]
MDFKPVDLNSYTRYWLDEYATILFRNKNDERIIQELRQQSSETTQHSEQEIASLIAQLSARESRYNLCRIMIEVFAAAWDELSMKEQALLEAIHRRGLTRTEAIAELSIELNCSESTVRRHYRKALQRFQKLFVG